MSSIHKASVFGVSKRFGCVLSHSVLLPFVWSNPHGGHGGCGQHAGWRLYLVFNDIEAKCLGQGHFRELRGPAVLYWEISELDGGHSHLSSLHIIWIGDEKVRELRN